MTQERHLQIVPSSPDDNVQPMLRIRRFRPRSNEPTARVARYLLGVSDELQTTGARTYKLGLQRGIGALNIPALGRPERQQTMFVSCAKTGVLVVSSRLMDAHDEPWPLGLIEPGRSAFSLERLDMVDYGAHTNDDELEHVHRARLTSQQPIYGPGNAQLLNFYDRLIKAATTLGN